MTIPIEAAGGPRGPLSAIEQEQVKIYAGQIVEAIKVGGIALAIRVFTRASGRKDLGLLKLGVGQALIMPGVTPEIQAGLIETFVNSSTSSGQFEPQIRELAQSPAAENNKALKGAITTYFSLQRILSGHA